MRVAALIRKLNDQGGNWVLILPPWPHLYHWKSYHQESVPWSQFFDLASLSEFIQVLDYKQFREMYPAVKVSRCWHLDTPDFSANDYSFEIEFTSVTCGESANYEFSKLKDLFSHPTLEDIFGSFSHTKIECFQAMGTTEVVETALSAVGGGELVLVDHFEVLMHDDFAGRLYWAARKSMVYAEHLRSIADKFMRDYLDYSPQDGKTGSYLSVHLRRADYVVVRSSDIPSIVGAVTQIELKLEQLNLSKVFIATDSPMSEVEFLTSKLGVRMSRFVPTPTQLSVIGDGGVSIVDQWIAAHAYYFIGTHESTFSFRIQEDRQLKGIPEEFTYNRLCPDNEVECLKPTRWKVVT